MFTQITIVKIENNVEDVFKVTFFNQNGVAYAEKIIGSTEVKACLDIALQQLIIDPRSVYADLK